MPIVYTNDIGASGTYLDFGWEILSMDTVARTYRLAPEILVQISSLADMLTNQYGFRVSQNDVIRRAVRELYERTKDGQPDLKSLIEDTTDDPGDYPLPVAR